MTKYLERLINYQKSPITHADRTDETMVLSVLTLPDRPPFEKNNNNAEIYLAKVAEILGCSVQYLRDCSLILPCDEQDIIDGITSAPPEAMAALFGKSFFWKFNLPANYFDEKKE